MLVAVFALLGVPIILGAFYGLVNRIDTCLRLYLQYLIVTFLVNLAGVTYFFFARDPCVQFQSFIRSTGSDSAEAFMCGSVRIATYMAMAVNMSLEVFFLWLIWSTCEDLDEAKQGPELYEILGKDSITTKAATQDGPYAGIVGFASTKLPGAHAALYGTISSAGRYPA